MACALPVVAAAGSGIEEVVRDGDNGLLVPPGDTTQLAAALGRLLRYPEGRESMGARGRAFVETEADSRACARRLEALYESVAAVGAAP